MDPAGDVSGLNLRREQCKAACALSKVSLSLPAFTIVHVDSALSVSPIQVSRLRRTREPNYGRGQHLRDYMCACLCRSGYHLGYSITISPNLSSGLSILSRPFLGHDLTANFTPMSTSVC